MTRSVAPVGTTTNTIHQLDRLANLAREQVARMLPPNSPKAGSLELALLKRHLAAAGIQYTCNYDAPLLLGCGRAVYRASLRVAGIAVKSACWIQ